MHLGSFFCIGIPCIGCTINALAFQMPGGQAGKTLTLVQAPAAATTTAAAAAAPAAPATTTTEAPVSSDADLAQLAAEAGLVTEAEPKAEEAGQVDGRLEDSFSQP